MKKLFLYTLFLLLCQACQETNNSSNTEQKAEVQKELINFDIEAHLKNYQNLKSSIANQKNTIKNRTDIGQKAKLELAENYLSKILVDSIFPYWLGTEWDFNGHTETPRQGLVACGYFVSTTLRDLDMKLNRYKIAQMSAADIIHALCDKESIAKLSSIDKLSEFMRDVNENEILIVGLDFHVGFLFKKNGKNYFAHSNYIQMKGVEIELAESSRALGNSNLYVIGNLTKNEELIRKWLNE